MSVKIIHLDLFVLLHWYRSANVVTAHEQ